MPLDNGVADSFDPTTEHQRSALLESNGTIYAGFGSFCDAGATSRGWVLGWNAATLAPISNAELVNRIPLAPADCDYYGTHYLCYLSSIWMSGSGIAADSAGNLFFTTGNTAPGTYNSPYNLAESMVKLSGDLSTVQDHFTPNDELLLDLYDNDFGAGGVLVLPDQAGPTPHLAVAAGKEGTLFIVNRDTGKMGGLKTPNVPASVVSGDCFCAADYYVGSDGVPRIVTSGGPGSSGVVLGQWTVNTAMTPALSLEGVSALLPASPEDPSAFTSISSNASNANTAIIWTVDRPDINGHLTLYAHNATVSGKTLTQIWSGAAGFWPLGRGNANLVPTVANGRVYVAGTQLSIFGLYPPGYTPAAAAASADVQASAEAPPAAPATAASAQHIAGTGSVYWGTVRSVEEGQVSLELRTGKILIVDLTYLAPEAPSYPQAIGRYYRVEGALSKEGVLVAKGISRVKGKVFWGPDRER